MEQKISIEQLYMKKGQLVTQKEIIDNQLAQVNAMISEEMQKQQTAMQQPETAMKVEKPIEKEVADAEVIAE